MLKKEGARDTVRGQVTQSWRDGRRGLVRTVRFEGGGTEEMDERRFGRCRRRYLESAARHTAPAAQPSKGRLYKKRQKKAMGRRRRATHHISTRGAGEQRRRGGEDWTEETLDCIDSILDHVDVANRVLRTGDFYERAGAADWGTLAQCTDHIRGAAKWAHSNVRARRGEQRWEMPAALTAANFFFARARGRPAAGRERSL